MNKYKLIEDILIDEKGLDKYSTKYIIYLVAFNEYLEKIRYVHHQLFNQPSIKPIYYHLNDIIFHKYIDKIYIDFHTLIENLNEIPLYNYDFCDHDSDSEEDYCDYCIEPREPSSYQAWYVDQCHREKNIN